MKVKCETMEFALVPKSILKDKSLTFAEKGLLIYLLTMDCDDISKILNNNNVDEPTLEYLLNALQENGFAVKTDKSYTALLHKRQVKVDAIKKVTADDLIKKEKQKLSLKDTCVKEIDSYTTNTELRDILNQYLDLRLHPQQNNRLAQFRIYNVYQWVAILKSLDNMKDKVGAVKYAIEHSYAKFIDVGGLKKENEKSLDGLGADSIVDLYDDSKEPF